MAFIARYTGSCGFDDCTTGVIEPGDEVTYDDDDVLMHHACASRARRLALPTLCETCWTHHRGDCA